VIPWNSRFSAGSPISFDGSFGGYKASGTGREYGMVGLSEYLEYKTVTRKH
jgi:acyl-CoA reductase-like NAD-dependent aldehyde dehydrogenase